MIVHGYIIMEIYKENGREYKSIHREHVYTDENRAEEVYSELLKESKDKYWYDYDLETVDVEIK